MGTIITVRKTQQAEAIQINSPEEEEVVRGWLSAMGMSDHAGIDPLKEQKFWFLKDAGSVIVYVVSAEDFAAQYEEVERENFQSGQRWNPVQLSEYWDQFTFEEPKDS
jgi:hypothetical protein